MIGRRLTPNCLLDSDAVIDLLLAVPSSVAFIRDLLERGNVLCVCDVVVAEVYSLFTDAERTRVQPSLESLLFLPSSERAARQAGIWSNSYAHSGVPLSTQNVLIAATAAWYDASLVTGNPADYPMPELRVLPLPGR